MSQEANNIPEPPKVTKEELEADLKKLQDTFLLFGFKGNIIEFLQKLMNYMDTKLSDDFQVDKDLVYLSPELKAKIEKMDKFLEKGL